MITPKTSAHLIVVFQKDNLISFRYADEIYKHFSRDISNPFELGIGIPVTFINQQDYKITDCFDEAEKNIILILIDENMFFDVDWKKYIDFIIGENSPKENTYFLPIGLMENAQSITENASKLNFLKMTEQSPDIYKLIFILAYRLVKILRSSNRSEEEIVDVSLFLSHEKKYGSVYAKRIKDNIKLVNIKTFLDENNIETGKDFSITIEKAIIDCSTFIIIQTDSYSSREWCVREVLQAKKNAKTIVVLDFLDEGEKRSFPYLGNSKVIKFNENINYLKMYAELLKETIRQIYFESNTRSLFVSLEITQLDYKLLNHPPEIITILNLDENSNKTLVYPDPQIGYEENELLKLASKKIDIQPRSSFIVKRKNLKSKMKSKKIGFSISETDFLKDHLDSKYRFMGLYVDISRYLIISGSIILYAGNIMYDKDTNFSEILYEFANGYNYKTNSKETRVHQYILNRHFDSKVKKRMVQYYPTIDVVGVTNKSLIETDEDLIMAVELTNLRRSIISNMDCVIFMGGKTSGYMGVIPGVLEEYLIAIELKKPIYLIGGFGGIANLIQGVLEKKTSISEFLLQININKDLVDRYNELSNQKPIDFNVIYENIQNYTFNNGLNVDDNILLMSTNNVEIIQSLLFVGLSNL